MSNCSRCKVVVAAGLAAALAPAGFAQCPMEWSAGFAARGLDGPVYAQAVFDDGRGPALYVGGDFNNAGEAIVQDVAKWDGTTWSAVGEGYWGWQVRAMCVFDDGTGPALYAGLDGNPGVRRWDGHAWSNLPVAISGDVFALAVFDDGTGPALYAGGQFDKADGVAANNIAK